MQILVEQQKAGDIKHKVNVWFLRQPVVEKIRLAGYRRLVSRLRPLMNEMEDFARGGEDTEIPAALREKLGTLKGKRRKTDALWYHLNILEEHKFAEWLKQLRERHPDTTIVVDPETRKMDGSEIILANDREKVVWAEESCKQTAALLERVWKLKKLLPLPEERKREEKQDIALWHDRKNFMNRILAYCDEKLLHL